LIERSVKSLFSLIVAGLGQIYSGQIGKGVIFIQPINGALKAVLIGRVLLSIVGHARRVHDRGAQRRALQLQVISVLWTDETY
jgi:hypothetical protein